MSKTIKNQRNWKFHQLQKQSNDNFKVYRANPSLCPSAVNMAQADLQALLAEAHFTQADVLKVSFREGFRRASKARLKVRNRRIEKRSARHKAMVEVRNMDLSDVED